MTTAGPTPDADEVSPRPRRRRRILSVVGVLGIGLLIFVFAYFEPQKAFIDDEVNETLPGLDAVLAAETTGVTTATQPPIATVPAAATPETSAMPGTSAADTATPDSSAATAIPTTLPPVTTIAAPANSLAAALAHAAETGQPVIASRGEFFSGEHTTRGTALVVALPDGSIVVRFEGLDTSNGPDLRVVLSPDPASDSWQCSDRLILDELKGNVGDQNYVIAGDVDLTRYHSVVIWCERFSVAFGAAAIDVQA